MAVRGAQAKKEITEKLLSTFEGSFLNNGGKEIRIPWVENGENLEIKVTLTCAKDNIGGAAGDSSQETVAPVSASPELTEDELKEVRDMAAALGF